MSDKVSKAEERFDKDVRLAVKKASEKEVRADVMCSMLRDLAGELEKDGINSFLDDKESD